MQNHRVLFEKVGRHARYICCSCAGKEIIHNDSMSFSEWVENVQNFKQSHPFEVPLFQIGGSKITLGRVVKSARAERNWNAQEMCDKISQTGNSISIIELIEIEESIVDVRQPQYDWLVGCVINIFDLVEDDRPWLEKLRSQAYEMNVEV
jgi:hypothetical protein